MPLRHVYTSLFSTGLHLQNSLLKLRHMEGLFESLEKSKDKETVANLMPNEKQLLEWLQGFADIQHELSVCITCLDGGVEEMEVMARPGSSNSDASSRHRERESGELSATESAWGDLDVNSAEREEIRRSGDQEREEIKRSGDQEREEIRRSGDQEREEIRHMDEVFEAFIAHDFKVEGLGFDDDFVPRELETEKETKQSNRDLKESVLNGQNCQTEKREVKALSIVEENGKHEDPSKSFMAANALGLSQETESEADSILSDTNTVKSGDLQRGLMRGSVSSLVSSLSLSSRTLSESSEDNRSDVEVDSNNLYSIHL